MRKRMSGVDTIKLKVIRIRSVSSKWKRRKKTKMEGRKNGVAYTIARVIQIKNTLSRRVAVNVKTVLLLLIKNNKHETYDVDNTTVDCKSC